MFRALTTLVTLASSIGTSIGHCSVKSVLFFTANIKSSVSLIEILAPVTFFKSRLILIKVSISGYFIDIVSIRAPLRPPCATSLQVLEKRSIKTPIPSVVPAAFAVGNPLGLIVEISNPTPPRRFIICACS